MYKNERKKLIFLYHIGAKGGGASQSSGEGTCPLKSRVFFTLPKCCGIFGPCRYHVYKLLVNRWCVAACRLDVETSRWDLILKVLRRCETFLQNLIFERNRICSLLVLEGTLKYNICLSNDKQLIDVFKKFPLSLGILFLVLKVSDSFSCYIDEN